MPNRRHRTLNRKWLFLLSLLMISRVLILLSGLTFFALGAYQYHIPYLMISGGCLALILLMQMIHAIESNKVVCPGCRSHILKTTRIAKSRRSKRLLGSHSLRVATQIIFTDSFTCQYCDLRYQWRGKERPTGQVH